MAFSMTESSSRKGSLCSPSVSLMSIQTIVQNKILHCLKEIKSKQELLARIAMLQAQKVRLTDYLDEISSYLTKFAEEANAEIDQKGENALRELDEAGARMWNIETRMQAFEESMELNMIDIEDSEKKVTDFEGKIEEDRNEGMFFKSFRGKTQVDKAKANEEAEKIIITKFQNIILGSAGTLEQ